MLEVCAGIGAGAGPEDRVANAVWKRDARKRRGRPPFVADESAAARGCNVEAGTAAALCSTVCGQGDGERVQPAATAFEQRGAQSAAYGGTGADAEFAAGIEAGARIDVDAEPARQRVGRNAN